MKYSAHISLRARSTRAFLVAGVVVALISVSAPWSAEAQNTAFGKGALLGNTTGTKDSAFGFDTLSSNTTGDLNTANGFDALLGNTVGFANTAIGADGLAANTAGYQNTATGAFALGTNTTGFSNTATGEEALYSNTTGSGNTAVGSSALLFNTTGERNIAIGGAALGLNTTGAQNIAIGAEALYNTVSGGGNIALGISAGYQLENGSGNIYIGNFGHPTESSTIRIGDPTGNPRTFIAGIVTSPVFGLPVVVNGKGRLGIQASSVRYKRDIHDMAEASDRLMSLRPVTFRYMEDPNGALQYGLIAEEVAQVYPELVAYGDDGKPLSVAYHMLPAMLLNELQKQVRENRRKDAQIAALQQQVEALQKETERIDGLTARLSALEQQFGMSIGKYRPLVSSSIH